MFDIRPDLNRPNPRPKITNPLHIVLVNFLNWIVEYFIYNYPNFRKNAYTLIEHFLYALVCIGDDHPTFQKIRIALYVILVYKIIKFALAVTLWVYIRSEYHIQKFVLIFTENRYILKLISAMYKLNDTYYNYKEHRIIYIVCTILYYLFILRYCLRAAVFFLYIGLQVVLFTSCDGVAYRKYKQV
jgi:hypothetical protein